MIAPTEWSERYWAWVRTVDEHTAVSWPADLVSAAPSDAADAVAGSIEGRMTSRLRRSRESVGPLRGLLASLLDAAGEHRPVGTIERFIATPGEATWSALVASVPGRTPVDRTRLALFWLLIEGLSANRVVRELSRRGPGPLLEPIARTGVVTQFDFAVRSQRAKPIDRKKAWMKLAILAAEARGHFCCVGIFGLSLEVLEGRLGDQEPLGSEIAEA